MKHFKKILMIFIMTIICNTSYAQAVAPTNLSLKGIVDWTRNFDFIMTGETLPEIVPAKGIWFIQWTGSVPKLYVSDGAVWTNFQSASIVDGSVTTPKLADMAVTTPKIAQNAITSEKLDNLAVTTPKLADNAITNDKLAVLSVDTVNVKDGAITSDKLAVDSVTSNKIVDGAITSNKVDSNLNEKTISLNNGTLDSPSLKFTSSINTGFSYNATGSVLILGWLGDEKVSISQDKLKLTDVEELNLDSENDIELSFTNEDTKIFGLKKWSLNNSLDLRLYNNLGGYLMSPIAIGATGSVIINNGQGADFPVDDGIHNLQVNGNALINELNSLQINAENAQISSLTSDIATITNLINIDAQISSLTSDIATITNLISNDIEYNTLNKDVCPFFTVGEPSTLIGGDFYSDGYFGEVTGDKLIYPWEVLNQLIPNANPNWNPSSITTKAQFTSNFSTYSSTISYQFTGTGYVGTEDNLEGSWLKFVSDGKIIFIAKKPILNSISWDNIQNLIPLMKEGADVQIDMQRLSSNYSAGYKVNLKCRLLRGGNHNPIFGNINNDRGKEGVKLGQGSEWNRLMYRICEQIPTDTDTNSGGAQVGSNWFEFTFSELGFSGSDTKGRVTLCQEFSDTNYILGHAGDRGIQAISRINKTASNEEYSFRPCLVFDPNK